MKMSRQRSAAASLGGQAFKKIRTSFELILIERLPSSFPISFGSYTSPHDGSLRFCFTSFIFARFKKTLSLRNADLLNAFSTLFCKNIFYGIRV